MRNQGKKLGLVFVISGPSGSGKTTLLENAVSDKSLKEKLARSISFTTRRKRSGERNGKDYFFISKNKFEELKKAKKILEWTKYLGYYYATPKQLVDVQLKEGKSVVLCLDLRGAKLVKKIYRGRVVTVFVLPPSVDVLHHRIKNRCNKTTIREIKQRMVLAEKELQAASRFDYCLLNENLEEVSGQLKDIILKNIKK